MQLRKCYLCPTADQQPDAGYTDRRRYLGQRGLLSVVDKAHYWKGIGGTSRMCWGCFIPRVERVEQEMAARDAFFAANPHLEETAANASVRCALKVAFPSHPYDCSCGTATLADSGLFDHHLVLRERDGLPRRRRYVLLAAPWRLTSARGNEHTLAALHKESDFILRAAADALLERKRSIGLRVLATGRLLAWWHSAGPIVALSPADIPVDLTYALPPEVGADWLDRDNGRGVVLDMTYPPPYTPYGSRLS